jgi:hypothetical protein
LARLLSTGKPQPTGVMVIVNPLRLAEERFAGNFEWAGEDSNLRPWD